MGIRRNELAFEGQFVQLPNTWVRDERLSRRARGLLAEVASHRVGWHVTTRSLAAAGPEGRDAVRAMLGELVDAGYLVADQQRGAGGRFGEIEYVLADPFDRDGKPVTVDSEDPRGSGDATVAGFSGHGGSAGVGFTVAGSAVDGESDTKNTRDKEHQLSEDDSSSSDAVASDSAGYSDEVKRLCDLLADHVRVNGHKVGTVGVTWWRPCERLMRLDGYTADQIKVMISWATRDEFWSANIRSMSKLREKFSTLRAQRNRQLQGKGPSVVDHGRQVDEILRSRSAGGHLKAVTS